MKDALDGNAPVSLRRGPDNTVLCTQRLGDDRVLGAAALAESYLNWLPSQLLGPRSSQDLVTVARRTSDLTWHPETCRPLRKLALSCKKEPSLPPPLLRPTLGQRNQVQVASA